MIISLDIRPSGPPSCSARAVDVLMHKACIEVGINTYVVCAPAVIVPCETWYPSVRLETYEHKSHTPPYDDFGFAPVPLKPFSSSARTKTGVLACPCTGPERVQPFPESLLRTLVWPAYLWNLVDEQVLLLLSSFNCMLSSKYFGALAAYQRVQSLLMGYRGMDSANAVSGPHLLGQIHSL